MKMNSTENNAICHISYTEVYEQKEVIIRAGRKLGWDYASCDDLVQEVAIKCWKNPKIQYDSAKGTKKSLLARIAHNTAIDIWRKNRKEPITFDDNVLEIIIGDCDGYHDNSIKSEDLRNLLHRAITELCRRYPSREVVDAFLMFDFWGMKAKEIAKQLDVNESFVNVSVHRCRKRIREIILQLER